MYSPKTTQIKSQNFYHIHIYPKKVFKITDDEMPIIVKKKKYIIEARFNNYLKKQ